MSKPNLEFLLNTPIEENIEKLNYVFQNLLQNIQFFLGLDPIYQNVKFEFTEAPIDLKKVFIDFGTSKTLKGNILLISVYINYKNFIKIILLREAYKCFVPVGLQDNEIVNIFINQKVEIDLQGSGYNDDWKEFRRKTEVNYEFLDAEFDRLEKFLKQEGTENKPSPFQYFISYIRKNVDLIYNIKGDNNYGYKGFYDLIYEEYSQKYQEYPEDILETIRIVTEIFYSVKSYKSILDYQRYFKEFKENGIIQTNSSQRKFAENMQWIKTFSTIAPSYQINWSSLDIMLILCIIKFNPLIETSKIIRLVMQMPFFLSPAFLKNGFGFEVIGYFSIPKIYFNDLSTMLDKMESMGLIIEKKIYRETKPGYTANLNCFRFKTPLLNPNKQNYRSNYELFFEFEYLDGTFKSDLSLIDWLLIDRIRYYSITGLGFERKSETLQALKSDLINEVQSQKNLINKLKINLNQIHNSPYLRESLLNFIDHNSRFGFFYMKNLLYDYIIVFNLISNILSHNPSVKNYNQFWEFIKIYGISKKIEDNIKLINLNKKIINEFLVIFLNSPNTFEEKIEEYQKFYKLFKSFHDLKLFNLESIRTIITDNSLIKKIYQSKEEKLKNIYESYKTYDITNQVIEQKLEDFLDNSPPIIKPSLIGTLGMARFTNFFITLILKNAKNVQEGVKIIKWLFPRILIGEISATAEKYIYLEIQMPNLKLKEKKLLYSTLQNLFEKNIIKCKLYLWSGFNEAFSRKDFYDLEQENFFYTKDLFNQFYLNIKSTLRTDIQQISESSSKISRNLFESQKSIPHLINKIENRISKENADFNLSNLNRLIEFNRNLTENLLEIEKFKKQKKEFFFRNYIKSIKFIPSFQFFGFGQYSLYFYPLDLNEIDFKHLLHNCFKKIRYSINIDNSIPFLIDFIWPHRNPNLSLFNWLTKSKKVIREYCLFFTKKVLKIFHFNYNLSVNKWDLDPNRFKTYFQNILYNQDYKLAPTELNGFNIGDLKVSDYFYPESHEYNALINLYTRKSIDIKSHLGTRNYTVVDSIIDLLRKKLIFPYISVKNLDLIEKINIILPNLKKYQYDILFKIFSFFNIGYIYEIEGEYFIYGMSEEIKFENGLMIKLYLPDCQLDEFEKQFDSIFEYLRIKHYIILNDLVDGKDFLKSIYGNLDFLKEYNPLKNLIWNDKDKIWMNHKLFDEKFEKIYPDLIPNKKS
ncbi:MAG: hypothetical protein ACFE9Z_06275 [Promethearchaeota archaeon]